MIAVVKTGIQQMPGNCINDIWEVTLSWIWSNYL